LSIFSRNAFQADWFALKYGFLLYSAENILEKTKFDEIFFKQKANRFRLAD